MSPILRDGTACLSQFLWLPSKSRLNWEEHAPWCSEWSDSWEEALAYSAFPQITQPLTKESTSRNADSLLSGVILQQQQQCTGDIGFFSHDSRDTKGYPAITLIHMMSFLSLNLQSGHVGAVVKEKVAMLIYLKPREALLTISYRNPGAKFSFLSLKQWEEYHLFGTLDSSTQSDQKVCPADRFMYVLHHPCKNP